GVLQEVTEGISKRAGDEIEQESAKKQRLEKEDDTTELKRCLEIVSKDDDDDDVTIGATPLSSKSPTIVDYKIYKEGKKSYFKIIRADGNSQNYLTFGTMFKNFNREYLEVLRSIVNEIFKNTKPVNDMDNLLFQTLKTINDLGYLTIRCDPDLGVLQEVTEGISKRAGDEIEQESAKKQRLEKEDDTTELKRCLEIVSKDDNDDDVTIGATPLSSKSPTIVDYKIYKEGKKSYFKIIRADGNSQNYLTFGTMFKNFNREYLEVLRSIVNEIFKNTKPVNDMDNLLFQTLKTMFEHHVEDNI
nr:hypothetical protein [Tanacetum cinerariifolium]